MSMIEAQRRMTRALIDDDPTVAALIPRVRTVTASGAPTYTDDAPRPAQRFKLSLLAYDQRPTVTVAGVERQADYHLIAEHDAEIEIDDYWVDAGGTRFDVVSETEGWDYMRKFVVIRTIPRNARP